MKNLRTYGKAPFKVAVIHGGPGAAGEMAPVARELSADFGVLEPLQTAATLLGQIEELKTVLEKNAALPVNLIGFSWGAWLSFMVTANYPKLVKKLILIGSAGFENKYAAEIYETRMSRLSDDDKIEVNSIAEIVNSPAAENKNAAFARLGTLLSKADAYDPITHESEPIDYQVDIYQGVWKAAAELRSNGKLLELGRRIQCPVVAIHGDYDPHPAEGVQQPLSMVVKDFRFILLEKCGHKPWNEWEAQDKFYDIILDELYQD
jgi:pimeloyl-ACP methyl ester carboxylesterase